MTEVDPFAPLVARPEAARTCPDPAEPPADAVTALEDLQETAREISSEIDRRRRALADERGDGQLDLL